MKKIEKILLKISNFFNKNHPSYFGLILFLTCLGFSLIIYKFRKKDEEDFQEENIFNEFLVKIIDK
jgi:hypothetical protein